MSAGIFMDYGDCLRGIVVERNGSPGFAGALLYAKYQTPDRIEKLFALGDLLELQEKLKPQANIGHYVLLEKGKVKEVRLQEGVCVSKNRDVRTVDGNIIKKGHKIKLREYKSTEVVYPFITEGLDFLYVFDKSKGQWHTYCLNDEKNKVKEIKVDYTTYIRNLVYRDDISELTREEKERLSYIKK